ncbi:MAG: hypothetical protein QOJ29_5113, partial [Thermoleophilaceae bacterium]|nr:hypothetical protein [Thermoleophilaceae bacterium]
MEEASLISKRLLGAAFSTTLAAIAFALPSTAAAATKIYSLRTASTQSIAALSPGSVGKGIVYSDGCTVQRVDVVPVTKTTTAPTVVVGAACNGTHAVRTTPATNLTAALGLDSLVAGTFNDDGLVIADKGRGFVDRYDAALGTLVTIAGNNGPNCATTAPPVDDSLAKDATLCNVSGLATHPSDASKFLLTDVAGAGASQGRGRVYLVSGTDRNTATIKTVAGSCNNAAATDALKLCITAPTDLFAGKGVVVFIDANTIALTTDSGLKTVSLTDGSVATVTTDGVTGLARGFSGDLYFSTTCQVKRYVI